MEYLEDAIVAAKLAGKYLREMYNEGSINAEFKSAKEIVTNADKGAEKIILDYLIKKYPSHKFISEESKPTENESDYVWYIDPLDGTTNFFYRIPYFNVSIALEHKKHGFIGVVYDPINDELFFAVKGQGAYLNGKKIKPNNNSNLKHAFITSCHGREHNQIQTFIDIMRKFKFEAKDMRKLGSAALELCSVACGRTDAFIGYGTRPWDVKAGILIARESGCILSGVFDDEMGSDDLLVSSPNLFEQIKIILKK